MNEDLRKWFDQNWVDISRKKKGGGHPPCGASADKGVRSKDSSKKYPKCVPANKAKNMSKKQKKSAVTRKRRAPNEPGSPDNVKTDVKKESWENWKPKSEKVYSKSLPSNNAPENPEPIGGAVAFEKSREKVLADLKEVIKLLIAEATPKLTYVPPHRAAQVAALREKQSTEEKQADYIPEKIKKAVYELAKYISEEYKRLMNEPAPIESKYEDLLNNVKTKLGERKFKSLKNGFETQLVAKIAKLEQDLSNLYPNVFIKKTELLPDDVCTARDSYKPVGLEKEIYDLIKTSSTEEYQVSEKSSTAGIILPLYFKTKCKTAGSQETDKSNPEYIKFWKLMNIPLPGVPLPRELITLDALKDAWNYVNKDDKLKTLLNNANDILNGKITIADKQKLLNIRNYIQARAGAGAIPSLPQTTPQPQQPINVRNPFAQPVAPPPKLNEEKLKKLIRNMVHEILKGKK